LGEKPWNVEKEVIQRGDYTGKHGASARFIPQHTQTHTQIGHTLCSGVPRPVVGHVCSFVR
jgi:hypothetical protein